MLSDAILSAQEESDLQGLGADLSGVLQTPWEPRCIAQAWRRPMAGEIEFTLQAWIDLAARHSPFLQLELPPDGETLAIAAEVFGLSLEGLTSDEAVDLAIGIRDVIGDGFAAQCPMRPSGSGDESDEGFGAWLPILACLVTQCGLSVAEALGLRVAQAYMLIAAHRLNQGWRVSGTPYAVREVMEKEARADA